MAVDFKTEHTRRNTYLFLPENITINPDVNGRTDLPDIEWMIESFLKKGQTTPVTIGSDGGVPFIIDGHCRWRTAIEINKRKLTPEPFRLECKYYKAKSEMEAFLVTISANHDRNKPTPIDDAHNIATLERYGMSLEDIAAKVYREDQKWVTDRLSLIGACEEVQDGVRSGGVKLSAAKELAKLSKAAQRQQMASGVKLTVAAIKRFAAPAPQSGAPEAPATSPAKRKWDLMAFRKLVESHLSNGVPDHVKKKSCDDILREVLGSILDALDEPPTEQ